MAAKEKAFGRLQVQVTDKDIEKAKANDSMMCVVAQAIARTFPAARRISVDIQSIRWSDPAGRHTYLTPYAVQGYIVAFDAGEEIQPFGFTLDSRKAIPVQRNLKTEAGTKLADQRRRVRAARDRQSKIEEVIAQDQTSPEPKMTSAAAKSERADAAHRTAEAEAALVSVKEAYQGQAQNRRVGEGHANPPPRVFKGSRSREYGMRKLRINQPLSTH